MTYFIFQPKLTINNKLFIFYHNNKKYKYLLLIKINKYTLLFFILMKKMAFFTVIGISSINLLKMYDIIL